MHDILMIVVQTLCRTVFTESCSQKLDCARSHKIKAWWAKCFLMFNNDALIRKTKTTTRIQWLERLLNPRSLWNDDTPTKIFWCMEWEWQGVQATKIRVAIIDLVHAWTCVGLYYDVCKFNMGGSIKLILCSHKKFNGWVMLTCVPDPANSWEFPSTSSWLSSLCQHSLLPVKMMTSSTFHCKWIFI